MKRSTPSKNKQGREARVSQPGTLGMEGRGWSWTVSSLARKCYFAPPPPHPFLSAIHLLNPSVGLSEGRVQAVLSRGSENSHRSRREVPVWSHRGPARHCSGRPSRAALPRGQGPSREGGNSRTRRRRPFEAPRKGSLEHSPSGLLVFTEST